MKDELTVDPQRAGQVRQLLAERSLASDYGQESRVAAADKQLAELGYKPAGEPARVSKSTPPQGRTSRSVEKTSVADEATVRRPAKSKD